MSSETEVDAEPTAREKYMQRLKEEAAEMSASRLATTLNREYVLAQLEPPLTADNLTIVQVCNYLGISSHTLNTLVHLHGDEMREAGYVPAHDNHAARYSRRAVLQLGLMLRPNASDQAVRIKKALGAYVPPRAEGAQRWMGHVVACKGVVAKAGEIAEAVQEEDPQETWNTISALDRWELQALVVTLGALLPLDSPAPFRYLANLGEKVGSAGSERVRADHGKKGHVARGLASLIPATKAEYEANKL